MFFSTITFASSSVKFQFKHQEVKPYPGNYSFLLMGPNGIRDGVYYTLTCQIINPSKEQVIIKIDYDPYRVCDSMGGCGQLTLNDDYTSSMLHLAPGNNDLKQTQLMTTSYYPNTKLIFTNYDNDYSVFIETCKAELE
jgi:hypothetical protein